MQCVKNSVAYRQTAQNNTLSLANATALPRIQKVARAVAAQGTIRRLAEKALPFREAGIVDIFFGGGWKARAGARASSPH